MGHQIKTESKVKDPSSRKRTRYSGLLKAM
jgi:hypothetical protein